MKKLFIYAVILMAPLVSGASEDYLTVDGEGHYIRADPLYRYLSTMCPLEKLEAYVNDFCEPSWPNITRHWEIRGRTLYFLKVEDASGAKYPPEKLFHEYAGGPVRAVWFNGIVSYRYEDSPSIMLNREYFEEEQVIRFIKGREVERYVINHRDRWISYARNILDQHHPLAGYSPDAPEFQFSDDNSIFHFLSEAYQVITQPEKKPVIYCPVVNVEFNVDLTDFKMAEKHKQMNAYELLESIAMETEAALHVSVSNRLVTYEIRGEYVPYRRALRDPVVTDETADNPSS